MTTGVPEIHDHVHAYLKKIGVPRRTDVINRYFTPLWIIVSSFMIPFCQTWIGSSILCQREFTHRISFEILNGLSKLTILEDDNLWDQLTAIIQP